MRIKVENCSPGQLVEFAGVIGAATELLRPTGSQVSVGGGVTVNYKTGEITFQEGFDSSHLEAAISATYCGMPFLPGDERLDDYNYQPPLDWDMIGFGDIIEN